MNTSLRKDRQSLLYGLVAFAMLGIGWYWALEHTPVDVHQGEVYRIIYLHVPAAFTAFFAAFVIFFLSLITLFRRSETSALWAKAAAEVGLIFTIITLASGSIWGRPTWGVWWTWDARLTTTLILALLYAGYLIFFNSLAPGPQRDRIAAALGILIAVDVPIIYKSVTWWRTLHQPPSIMRPGGSTIAPEMAHALYFCVLTCILVAAWMMVLRVANLKLQQRLEQYSYDAQG